VIVGQDKKNHRSQNKVFKILLLIESVFSIWKDLIHSIWASDEKVMDNLVF